jgi:tRNA (guanine37-N1)-methyltransferase
MFEGFVNESIIKRAIEEGHVTINLVNPRDFTLDKHKHVDDTPYGGGHGMVLACQPMFDCLKSIDGPKRTILMTPQGTPYKQKDAIRLSKEEHIVLVCGHYEGFDERIRTLCDEEISIGDYVLTGGEIPAMAISDSVIRLLNGVIEEDSHLYDSHSNGLLEHPQYTKPAVYEGLEVPSVLLNGNHKLIALWREKESLRNTFLKRPDLLENYQFSKQELEWLEEFKKEIK